MTATVEHEVWIEGIAFWSPALPGWALAAPALRGETSPSDTPARRPVGALLAANERRRAPDTVLLALEVAQAAVQASGRAADTLASVFTSAYGDLPIVDALCRTLASDPLLLSPLRFHHSVHNAASGYWAIGSGSHRPSTALAAGRHSFAAGLLEAAAACAADGAATLLVGHDGAACGPLASVNPSRGLLGVALVLAPQRGAAAQWCLRWRLRSLSGSRLGSRSSSWLDDGPTAPLAAPSLAARTLADNAQADALPLFEALARGAPTALGLPLSDRLQLHLELQPLNTPELAQTMKAAADASSAP